MRRISRYLLRELLVPLGVWVAFMFLLLFVMQFLRGTDVLLGSSVTAWDLLPGHGIEYPRRCPRNGQRRRASAADCPMHARCC